MPAPTERVVALSSQGLSEPEIIQAMKQEGYSPVQVDGAMREALRGAAAGGMQQPAPRYAPPQRTEYAPPARGYPPERRPQPRPYAPQPAVYDDVPEEEEDQPGYAPPQKAQLTRPPMGPDSPGEPPLDFEQFKRSNKNLGFPEVPGREAREEDELPEDEEEPEIRPIPRLPNRDRTPRDMKQEKTRMLEELTEGVVEEKFDHKGESEPSDHP